MSTDLRALVLLLSGAGLALATTEPGEAPPTPRRLHCQVFPAPLSEPFDTRDHSTELGQWVLELESRGWQLHEVDVETGTKPTGFPQGFVQVCMTPRLKD